ncbi:murein peptide amidase A [Brevibacillus dissolubilis]|uniref:murein peptide amidase A n=1 Tax=Brevibacillus dissolubilis TaxID=1844116 RepID=UPI001117A3DC|nr:murein peptide amidase A [Brevibacillus dissolubilis]
MYIRYTGALGQPPSSSRLVEELKNTWQKRRNKGEVFDLLRQQKTSLYPLDSAVDTFLTGIFGNFPDDLWLAKTIAKFGPEPLWPVKEIEERVKRATVSRWCPEFGNIEAILTNPDPEVAFQDAALKPLVKCYMAAEQQLEKFPVKAYFFPGRSSRRALIIGGVHGSEPAGVRVVQRLREALTNASIKGNPPFFTTILVPVLFPRTLATKSRNVSGGLGLQKVTVNQQTNVSLVCREIEPNRNFPLPGENYSQARKRGQTGTLAPELMIREAGGLTISSGSLTSTRMVPENRILIQLIERFQPERLASIHAHQIMSACHPCGTDQVTGCGGEGPGIFVDPRGIDPATKRVTDQNKVDFDDKLTNRMLAEALKRLPALKIPTSLQPFGGNMGCFKDTNKTTVRYFSKQRVQGNSLGDWAPVDTAGRAGITTLTIELPNLENKKEPKEFNSLINLHSDLLQEIFLMP